MLAAAIRAADGFLPFARWMDLALYAPGLGYYVAGTRKFGAGGDFVTAPELTPLYAQALATDVEAILAASPSREIVEWGAGSGRFAADLLAALDQRHVEVARYAIVETSPGLRERQRERLAADPRVVWLDAPPARIGGAVIMNEVLDAIAPALVVRRDGHWRERGVVLDGERFAWAERPLGDAALEAAAAVRFPPSIDYAGEINLAAEALVAQVAASLAEGALLVVDYGFPRAEYYHPQRAEGTLMAHYRHRATPDVFLWPGLADITAHVDFTGVAEAGAGAGLAIAGYTTQAAYLLGTGILDRLLEVGEPGSKAFVHASTALQTLTSPAEMGDLFKVLALARSPQIRWRGFAVADKSHTL
ncbi:MAG TPA: SAM-dependent methyltransferase [Casimicrobiaceae bacterium]|nr:SAM-dependent methyltransferase [Casimicrobiaceae bacterium]